MIPNPNDGKQNRLRPAGITQRKPYLRGWLALFVALAALVSLTGCTVWKSSSEQEATGQATATEAASKIEGAEITRAEFHINSFGISPEVYLDLSTPSTDEAEAKRIMLAGYGVVVAVADRLDMDCYGNVYLTDGNGRRYDARDFGFDSDDISSDEVRELLR